MSSRIRADQPPGHSLFTNREQYTAKMCSHRGFSTNRPQFRHIPLHGEIEDIFFERTPSMTVAKKITKADIGVAGATGLCAGANLRTPIGARRVEFLRKGDLVVTRDNGLQAVRMIWARTITASEFAADPSLAPVLLAPRAIGPMMPQSELRVGGAHRLLIPGWRLEDEDDGENCLVPARDVDGLSLGSDVQTDEVTYYNVVFDEPQVFCANGLPVESFTPSEASLIHVPKAVQDDLRNAFPELGPKFSDYPAPRYKMRERVSYTPDFA